MLRHHSLGSGSGKKSEVLSYHHVRATNMEDARLFRDDQARIRCEWDVKGVDAAVQDASLVRLPDRTIEGINGASLICSGHWAEIAGQFTIDCRMMYNRVHPPLETGRINIMVVEVSVDAVDSWKISLGKEKVRISKSGQGSVDMIVWT